MRQPFFPNYFDRSWDSIFNILAEVIPPPIESAEDETYHDALGYELLRLDHGASKGRMVKSLLDERLTSNNDSDEELRDRLQELREFSNRLVTIRMFMDDVFFDSLTRDLKRISKLFGTNSLVAEVKGCVSAMKHVRASVGELLRKDQRMEPRSLATDGKLTPFGRVPDEITPAGAIKLREALFAFRWCLLLGYAYGLGANAAIEVYQNVHKNLRNVSNPKRPSFSETAHSLVENSLPDFDGRAGTNIISTLKPVPWALAFMHADYASVFRWHEFGDRQLGDKLPFLPRFVMDQLGVHLLRAKYEYGYDWRDERWGAQIREAFSKAGRRGRRLPFVEANDRQPIKIKGAFFAFDYASGVRPEVFEQGPKVETITPEELFS